MRMKVNIVVVEHVVGYVLCVGAVTECWGIDVLLHHIQDLE